VPNFEHYCLPVLYNSVIIDGSQNARLFERVPPSKARQIRTLDLTVLYRSPQQTSRDVGTSVLDKVVNLTDIKINNNFMGPTPTIETTYRGPFAGFFDQSRINIPPLICLSGLITSSK
jgi:hypothetical protein